MLWLKRKLYGWVFPNDLMLLGVGPRAAAAPGGGNFLVQEVDGTSRITLEDGTGSLLLEV